MKIGIDKLRLTTTDFSLKKADTNLFGFNRSTSPGQTDLPCILTDLEGQQVYAKSMYSNCDVTGISVDFNQYGMAVTFNPNKQNNTNGLNLVGIDDRLHKSLKIVESRLNKIGIETDIDFCKISRIDLCKDAMMDYQIKQYDPAFRSIPGNKRAKATMYGNGTRFGNDSTEAIMYGKGLLLQLPGQEQLMRCETKWKLTKAVKSAFGVPTIKDLLSVDNNYLNDKYTLHLKKNVFGKSELNKLLLFDFDHEIGVLRTFMAQRNGLERYIAIQGIETLIEKFNGLDNFINALTDVTDRSQRNKITRAKSKMTEMLQQKSMIDRSQKTVSTSTLLAELKQKFVA